MNKHKVNLQLWKGPNRHKCTTYQAESKRVTFYTSWMVSFCGARSGKTFISYDKIKLYLKNQALEIENGGQGQMRSSRGMLWKVPSSMNYTFAASMEQTELYL